MVSAKLLLGVNGGGTSSSGNPNIATYPVSGSPVLGNQVGFKLGEGASAESKNEAIPDYGGLVNITHNYEGHIAYGENSRLNFGYVGTSLNLSVFYNGSSINATVNGYSPEPLGRYGVRFCDFRRLIDGSESHIYTILSKGSNSLAYTFNAYNSNLGAYPIPSDVVCMAGTSNETLVLRSSGVLEKFPTVGSNGFIGNINFSNPLESVTLTNFTDPKAITYSDDLREVYILNNDLRKVYKYTSNTGSIVDMLYAAQVDVYTGSGINNMHSYISYGSNLPDNKLTVTYSINEVSSIYKYLNLGTYMGTNQDGDDQTLDNQHGTAYLSGIQKGQIAYIAENSRVITLSSSLPPFGSTIIGYGVDDNKILLKGDN